MDIDLRTACRFLPGVGPARAAALATAGIQTIEDLLLYLPFRYEDRSRYAPIAELQPGRARTTRAVIGAPRLIRTRRRGFVILEAMLRDDTGSIRAIWYNQPFLRNILREGRAAAFFGEPRVGRGRRTEIILENPRFEILVDEAPGSIHTGRVVPVYQRIDPISPRGLRQIMHAAVGSLPARIPDPVPAELRRRLSLPDRGDAFRWVHFPPPGEIEPYQRGTSDAHRRLVFEEMFLLQAGLAMQKKSRLQQARDRAYTYTAAIRNKLRAVLPYRLTAAQRRTLREIVADLRGPAPMNRLLQGDVGSGKTIVALLAMLVVVENGYQAVLMVPTGILAEQHYLNIRNLLRGRGYRIGLLTGAVKGDRRREILGEFASGSVQIAIGTHALIQDRVRFGRLGMVVIDEQHRFGVAQRARLQEGNNRPDILVMTATPIPRTLTLTLYGDLDLSLLDELPPGRRPVRTFLRDDSARDAIHGFIRDQAGRGRQAYIVSPRLEDTDRSRLQAARSLVRQLQDGPFHDLSVALLHGRMTAEDKDRTMAEFAAGGISVLVATTVVEVGIDVPGATVMVIENAERFGLSQLHQLRGRVGRGRHPGVCILLVGKEAGEDSRRRLQVLAGSTDGFAISEADLEIRGPGELLGVRQAGVPDVWWTRLLRNRDLLEIAREAAAAAVFGGDPDTAAVTGLHRYVEERWPRRFGRIQVG